jgi:hypothetical protein
MRQALITAVQRAIILYVVKNEGKNYTGDHTFRLTYIKRSKNIPEHRKRDIETLNQMCIDSNTNNTSDIELAADIYKHLVTIKTGVMFLWLFHIGNSSVMRDLIHHALFIHDPELFLACKEGKADKYEREEEEDNQQEFTAKLEHTKDEQEENVAEQYVKLKKDNSDLQIKLQEVQKSLSTAEQKSASLADSLSKQSFANEGLRRKMDKIVQKNSSAITSEVEMSPRHNKTEYVPLTDLPNQVNMKRSIS